MNVRFCVPFRAYVWGPSEEALGLKATFKYCSLVVTASFEGNEASNVPSSSASPYAREVTRLRVVVEGIRRVKRGARLLRLLSLIANSVIGAIRNFAEVRFAQQVPVDPNNVVAYLQAWQVEVSENLDNWKRLVEPSDPRVQFTDLARALDVFQGLPHIESSKWSRVEEALKNGVEVGVVLELRVNTLEHLGRRNYRLAALESVACLEVAVSDFLRKFLSTSKRLPMTTVDFMLHPKVGVKDRIKNMVAPNLSSGSDYEPLLSDVYQVIDWRNGVLHITGRLPKGISDSDKSRKIAAVLVLAEYLDKLDALGVGP